MNTTPDKIIWCKRRTCFVIRNGHTVLPLMGVTLHMKKYYWGAFDGRRSCKKIVIDITHYSTEQERLVLARAFEGVVEVCSRSRARSQKQGMRRGVRVDKELTKCTAIWGEFRIKPWVFMKTTTKITIPRSLSQRAQRNIRNLQKNMFSWTRALLSALQGLGLFPFMSQVKVASQNMRLGTACDLVCTRSGQQTLKESLTKPRDSRQGVVIVEIKTGYQDRYTYHSGMMAEECSMLDNHPLNQHQLQLLATVKLFELTYGNSYRVDDAFILRIDNKGIWMYRLLRSIQTLWPAIKARLLQIRKAALARAAERAERKRKSVSRRKKSTQRKKSTRRKKKRKT